METFSSEIGKKMRSAVKAKLIELGTEGGSSGYVDDELPDYVMIMVANKRSKQQMTSDLTLFLGNKTELFVAWLHEVLQKLQEVTIPAPTAKKRKSGQKDEESIKKDKKTGKKDKKPLKKPIEQTSTEKAPPTESNATVVLPPTGSITDAFAEELLEKAKHNMDAVADATNQIKKGKSKKSGESNAKDGGNAFDIPTITEISSTTGSTNNNNVTSGNRQKDLAELAEIQKKIYAAKRHLKELGEIKDQESEDEDFIRLRHEGSSDMSDTNGIDNGTKQQKPKSNDNNKKEKSPIIFDQDKKNVVEEKSSTPPSKNRARSPLPNPPPSAAAAVKTVRSNSLERRRSLNTERTYERERRTESIIQRERERDKRETSPYNRRPIHERLGIKTQTSNDSSRTPRREKELYVPAHRRQENRNDREYKTERWRSRERERDRDRERERDERRKSRERSESRHISRVERQQEQLKKLVDSEEDKTEPSKETRQRIGSRVIVAPVKPQSSSDNEIDDKPVNSIIKIKPRPTVSPSKQACKTLLLRAVAEAQRSTILTKSKPATVDLKMSPVKSRLGKTIKTEPLEELFTKTLRERRLKRSASGLGPSTLFRRQIQNFIVKVDGELQNKRRRNDSPSSAQNEDDHENLYGGHEEADEGIDTMVNFTVKPLTEEGMVYEDEEQLEDLHSDDSNDEYNESDFQKTKFVVTLNDEKTTQKYRRHNIGIDASPPHTQVSSSSSSLIRNHRDEPSSTTTQPFSRSRPRESRRSDIRSRLSKRPATPLSPSRSGRLKERETNNSSPSSTNTPPRQQQQQQQQRSGAYRKAKDVKKIIIKNDTDDEELSSPRKHTTPDKERNKRTTQPIKEKSSSERRSRTPSLPRATELEEDRKSSNGEASTFPVKNKHTPIKFDLDTNFNRTKSDADSSSERNELVRESKSKSRERSIERQNCEERRRISIREINNKYDNIPALSSISLESNSMRVIKPKERCKYHPNCTKQFCDFYHPSAPCKSFPNCKYADKCMYSHPKCKYDMACTNLDCNFSHSGQRNTSLLQPTAPPLSSHVVPVQNYKTISVAAGASSAMCKYYPNCTKSGCTFYHPKACRFGKNCINKLECNFYHHELQSSSKFKWVASAT